DPNAVLPDDTTLVSGSGSFGVLLSTSGTRTVTASNVGGGATGTSPNITVVAGALAQFGVNNPAFFPTGVQQVITVTAQDQFGNTVTTYTGQVHLSSSDPGASFPINNSTMTNGTGTFAATLATLGTQFLSANDVATPSIVGSNTAFVTAGTLNHFKISAPASV